MKKVKITESQKAMLDKAGANLQESIPRSQSPSAKVTDTFKSEVKGIKGFKAESVGDIITPDGVPQEQVEWSELVLHVHNLVKQLYTNPSKEGLDPYWETLDVTWDEIIGLLSSLDIIKSVKGGYRLIKFVGEPAKAVKIVATLIKKMVDKKVEPEVAETTQADIAKSFKDQVSEPKNTGKTRQELLDTIARKRTEELARRKTEAKGLEEGDWFDNHPDHPANQQDTTQHGIKASLPTYNIVWYSDDVSIFEKDGQYFAYNVTSADIDEYSEYADREAIDMGPDEDGFANTEYGDWSLDSEIVNAYVNDNIKHLNFGRGLDDYENGVDMSLITIDLAQDLTSFGKHIGGNDGANLIKLLSTMNLEETTTAAGSSGAFVGKMGVGPIHKGNVGDGIKDVIGETGDEMSVEGDIINTLKQLTLDGNVDVAEWFSFETELKRVVDLIQSLNNEEWNPVIMFIIKSLQVAENVMAGNKEGTTKFKQYLRSLAQFINHFSSSIGEVTTVTSAGGDSGTFAFDVPMGDGEEFWTAGNKMAKKGVNEDAKTDTQYPNGEFVEFDDCVKYNNNKVAQNGGCSTGAVDNVVKTKTSKNSVISDNTLYSEISKATGRTISEVKSLIENKINGTI